MRANVRIIEEQKLKIKELKEERDDTDDLTLNDKIKECWKLIHEVEEHQTARGNDKVELVNQLKTAQQEFEDATEIASM